MKNLNFEKICRKKFSKFGRTQTPQKKKIYKKQKINIINMTFSINQ